MALSPLIRSKYIAKFGDKEHNGYTWEIIEEERVAESCYIIVIAEIKKREFRIAQIKILPGKYVGIMHYIIPKTDDFFPTESWIEFEIYKREFLSDGFGIDEYNFSEEEIARRRRGK